MRKPFSGQVPAGGIQAEEFVVQYQPGVENRPPVVALVLLALDAPDRQHHHLPGRRDPEPGIFHDLGSVVVDKLPMNRLEVQAEDDRDQERSDHQVGADLRPAAVRLHHR